MCSIAWCRIRSDWQASCMSRIGERSSDVVIRPEAFRSPHRSETGKVLQTIRTLPLRGGIFGTQDNYTVYCCPFRRRTCFTVQREYLRRLPCRPFPQWRLLTATSAATQTAIIACGLAATTTGTDVGGSLNTAKTQFTAVLVGGYAIPMGTGVILNTLAGRGNTGSTTTRTTATGDGNATPRASSTSRPGVRGPWARVTTVLWAEPTIRSRTALNSPPEKSGLVCVAACGWFGLELPPNPRVRARDTNMRHGWGASP